jgi:hypothetical protein
MFSIYRSQESVSPLREVWEQADDSLREAILEAIERVNERLHHEPHTKGESRTNTTRILFEAPVAVLYEVDDEKQLVNIVRSWAYRTAA